MLLLPESSSWALHQLLWLLLCLPVSYWIIWVIYARTLHPLSNIPGPWFASVSRLWIMWHTWKGDMDHVQRALHQRHGTIVRIAPHECACSDPDAIKLIYKTQAPLEKTDFYPPWRGGLSKYPDHFTVTSERLHSERRRIVNNIYSMSNVLQSERYIDECSKLFAIKLGELADQAKQVDLGEWLQWYAFDVIGELYFGQMFGFLQHSHDHANYIASLDTLMPPLCLSAVAPSYMRPFILPLSMLSSTSRKAVGALGHIATAAKDCVARRCQSDGPSQRRDMLHQLLDIMASKGEKVDFGIHEVEQEAYTGLFAGSDTTAIALRSVFYHLLRHPASYKRLQSELSAAIAAITIPTSGPIPYASATQLPYLNACIKEAMRLHPSVGFTMPRIAPTDGLHFKGPNGRPVVVPHGYRVGMNAAVVHRNADVFGAQPAAFRPERWLDDAEHAKAMDRCMLHFGAGTRTCIGKNISLSELYKLVPQVLRDFDLSLANPAAEWKTHNLWFNKQTGLVVNVRRRVV